MAHGFHSGELAVQRRAGVLDGAARVGGSIRREIPPAAQAFLEQRRWVVLATVAPGGRPWASILTGQPGFASSPTPGTVRLDAAPLPGSPLAESLGHAPFAGLLAMDLATRRRMRINGRLEGGAASPITILVDQAYSNCPKYIQRRPLEGGAAPAPSLLRRRAEALDDRQRAWIRRADTFFIATTHPGEGADASHRGGLPGFVQVEGERLVWPDYAGNMMFNTLGNLAVYPRAGLAFPDFGSGAVLHVTGRAAILWEPPQVSGVPGAERLVTLDVEEVVELEGVLPPAAEVDYSPFNPPAA